MKVFGEQQLDTLDIMSNRYSINDEDSYSPQNNCRFGL